MNRNKNMHKAKKNKNDEFYTQLSDIEKELKNYRDHFKGKTIFLNCDDPEESNFWLYFSLNFEFFGMKKLIATHYETEKPSYKLELNEYKGIPIKTPLKQNGDFRSDECIEILKESDMVVTNPPFSLFREFIAQLIEYDKKFLIIGNQNAVKYKEIFPLLKDNKIWLGYTSPSSFRQPDGDIPKDMTGLTRWFTNLEISKRNEEMILFRKYYDDPTLYPNYDNYDAINIDKVQDIPCDYYGYMGVPITFMDKFNPKQFELCGTTNEKNIGIRRPESKHRGAWIDGREKYTRILIKRIKKEETNNEN